MDILKIKELENRMIALETIKKKAIRHELYIETTRGIYKIPFVALIEIVSDTNTEILKLRKQLEELTGLNEDRLIYLNGVGR